MTKRDETFMNIAKEISRLSDYPNHHVGCIAVEGKRVLSTACNSQKTHPLQCKYNRFRNLGNYPAKVHAEIACLSPLIGKKEIDFSQIKLYIYREHKNGVVALARPCLSCAQLIKDLGIKNVYYTGEDSLIYERYN